MKKLSHLAFDRLPTTYEGLCKLHLPRPIHDRVGLENSSEIVDLMAGHDLNAEQEDYLDLLSDLVADYEDKHSPLKARKMTPVEALQYLLEQSHTNATGLARILGLERSHGPKIMRGERRLTADHISKLAIHFSVSPKLFLGL